MTRLAFILGTRPEAIKLAPVIYEARDRFDCCVIASAQHRELMDQVLQLFAIQPDHDLDLMRANQRPADLTARLLTALDPILATVKPDRVIVQGDTTTALAGALAAGYRQIPIAHVEAGLRTADRRQPFPEELNRALIAQLATLHFAPTDGARDNLLSCGIAPETVHVTGNTVIDSLQWVLTHAPRDTLPLDDPDAPCLLVTAHRRESRGAPIESVARAVEELVAAHAGLQVVFSVHPHPDAGGRVRRLLSDTPRVRLTDSLDYATFVQLMSHSHLILTDSGGVQEEGPALGKPVLVLRNVTERPEGLEAGGAELVGLETSRIFAAANRLLTDQAAYAAMAQVRTLYGDGKAAARICDILASDARE